MWKKVKSTIDIKCEGVKMMFNCDSCYKDVSKTTTHVTLYGAEYELCEECLPIFVANDKTCEEI